MGDVINFQFGKSDSRDRYFTLSVAQDEEGYWSVRIPEFYNKRMAHPAVCREVASLLPTMMAGLIDIAERTDPSDRGNCVGIITIYGNGTIDMLMEPLDTNSKRTWMGVAVDKVRNYVARISPAAGRD